MIAGYLQCNYRNIKGREKFDILIIENWFESNFKQKVLVLIHLPFKQKIYIYMYGIRIWFGWEGAFLITEIINFL